MFNKKYKKKQLKNELQNLNATYAHKEMVIKSGGGINNLLQKLDDANYVIELKNQKIERLHSEIKSFESRLIELTVTYKFKNSFFIIEINKILFFDIIKKYKFFRFCIYVNTFLKNKLYIKIIESKRKFYYLFSFKKIFKTIILFLNLLFFINNFNKLI